MWDSLELGQRMSHRLKLPGISDLIVPNPLKLKVLWCVYIDWCRGNGKQCIIAVNTYKARGCSSATEGNMENISNKKEVCYEKASCFPVRFNDDCQCSPWPLWRN